MRWYQTKKVIGKVLIIFKETEKRNAIKSSAHYALIKKYWNVPFLKRKLVDFSEMEWSVMRAKSFYVYNMIRFRLAMKSTFLEMKYDISLRKRLVSSTTWNESFCKWILFVFKMDRSISEKATSCLYWNGSFQNSFISA